MGMLGERGKAMKRYMGGGCLERNGDGEAVLEVAVAHDLVICNALFCKKEEHLATYVAMQEKSQIDLMLVRREDKRRCRNCKVIPSQWEEGQHRLVVMDLEWGKEKDGRRKRKGMERVK